MMNRTRMTLALLAAGLITTCGVQAATGAGAGKPTLPPASNKQGVTFATDIKPLFEASCVRCHSGQRAKAALRLDTLEGVLAGGKNEGKAFNALIPGNSEKSLIVEAVARVNPKTAMPPEQQQRGGAPRQNVPGNPPPQMSAADASHATPMAEGAQPPAPRPGARGGAGGFGGPRGNQGPPPKPLTAEEVGLVRAWIDQGAK